MNKAELIVELAKIVPVGDVNAIKTIEAHNYFDRYGSFINSANCHLFRKYRNNVSANPAQLLVDIS